MSHYFQIPETSQRRQGLPHSEPRPLLPHAQAVLPRNSGSNNVVPRPPATIIIWPKRRQGRRGRGEAGPGTGEAVRCQLHLPTDGLRPPTPAQPPAADGGGLAVGASLGRGSTLLHEPGQDDGEEGRAGAMKESIGVVTFCMSSLEKCCFCTVSYTHLTLPTTPYV